MSWLRRLASEISEAKGSPITEDELLQKFNFFITNCGDRVLRESYPKDLHHARRAENPQSSTRDIILSFMDREFPGLPIPYIEQLSARLNEVADSCDRQLAKVLAKERERRWSKTQRSYWGRNQKRIREKYAGLYALLRIDSANNLQAESFGILPIAEDPTTVTVHWFCKQRMLVGDLIVNTYRFSGLIVQQSTDAVIEPGCISILRAPRATFVNEKGPLVLGGFISGWKDDEPTALFQSRIALIQLDLTNHPHTQQNEFGKIITDENVQKCLRDLKTHESVRTVLVPEFLRVSKMAMGPVDARNALPNLDRKLLSVKLPR